MANLTYEERVALEQQKEALRRQREDERRNGVAGVRANDTRIAANNDAMHGRAGRKWLGGEAVAVSSGDALHGQAGRKWLGGGGQQTQDPQSRISFFASDGQGRISRGDNASGEMQVRDTDVWGNDWRLRMYDEQKASHDEMGQVMQAVRQKKAQQQIGLQNDIASLMKYAQGGVIPEELRQLVNRKYGFDGVKSGLLPSSGFTQNGDFALQLANGVDRNGNVQVQTIGINPFQQYSMMQMNDAAFDDNDRAALRQRLKQNYGYSDRELAAVERMRVPNLKQALEERKMALAEQKQRDVMERFRQTMAQKNAPKSKTDFIGKMFESGNYANRLSTEDDVANNRATTVGEPIERTPEELIEYLGNIYDKIYRNQDPALGGGQTATTPSFDESRYPNATKAAMAQANANPPAAPGAGGGAEPAQTATPSPSATATPPAEGQGEFDFGGAEPEAAPAATLPTKQTSTSDEEEERKRRQAAKPKSNSWKNSTLFSTPNKTEEEQGGSNAPVERDDDDKLANPQDGDELPLQGGGTARYDGRTRKWVEVA